MGSLQELQQKQQPREEEEEEVTNLVKKISSIHAKISTLSDLSPSSEVDKLFTELVTTCIPPSSVDVSKLTLDDQAMRRSLIKLCGRAEGLLESHYSAILGSFEEPLEHLTLFPYYSNYLKLSLLEHNILVKHTPAAAATVTRVAFIGSGPLPLTSIVLARDHMKDATFDNYDVDVSANSLAARLTAGDEDLAKRMVFHTTDIMDVTDELREYDVVFLAALVGMGREEKLRVLDHLADHMAPDAVLMLRSAAGARAFLYPVIEPCDLPNAFEALSVFHPTDEVINSVVISRKKKPTTAPHHHHATTAAATNNNNIMLPCKFCSKMEGNFEAGGIMEELVINEQAS